MTGKALSPANSGIKQEEEPRQEMAWDGLEVSVSSDWTLVQLDRRFLGFTAPDSDGLVCEIRWQQRMGRRFNPQKALRQIGRSQTRSLASTIRPWSYPQSWDHLDTNTTLTGFTWKTDQHSGHGLIRYCQTCQTAVMVQLLNLTDQQVAQQMAHLLAGLDDHPTGPNPRWRVFDMDCRVPPDFALERFRFHPGHFELAFKTRRQRLVFFRWAPADGLLQDDTLLTFARNRWPAARDILQSSGPSEIAGIEDQTPHLWHRWKRRFSGTPAFRWYRLWHQTGPNRLLGIQASGRRPFTNKQLEQLTHDFKVV